MLFACDDKIVITRMREIGMVKNIKVEIIFKDISL